MEGEEQTLRDYLESEGYETSETPTDREYDFWQRLAERFKESGYHDLAKGLSIDNIDRRMNELESNLLFDFVVKNADLKKISLGARNFYKDNGVEHLEMRRTPSGEEHLFRDLQGEILGLSLDQNILYMGIRVRAGYLSEEESSK